MTFNYDEESMRGYKRALKYLLDDSGGSERQIRNAGRVFLDLIEEYGPVVSSYPTWHPLVPQDNPGLPATCPSTCEAYKGLDHTVLLVNAFITCPYGDGSEVLESVAKLQPKFHASVTAERLDVHFYNERTSAILVKCEWGRPSPEKHRIPKSYAVPLMLQEEIRGWMGAEVAERWESLAPYILGEPCGDDRSLFVTSDTGKALKEAYLTLADSGMFGPYKSY